LNQAFFLIVGEDGYPGHFNFDYALHTPNVKIYTYLRTFLAQACKASYNRSFYLYLTLIQIKLGKVSKIWKQTQPQQKVQIGGYHCIFPLNCILYSPFGTQFAKKYHGWE